jgi:hypothetical protein
MTRRRTLVLAALLVAGLSIVWLLLLVCSDRFTALDRYNRIGPGMTRREVKEIMADIPDALWSSANSVDLWHIGRKYFLMVKFEPSYYVKPGTVNERDPEGDNWTVESVDLFDLSAPNPVEEFLWHFGLRTRWPGVTKTFR